jgi:PAS domain S-box-containing protein
MVPSSNENVPHTALWASDERLQLIIDSALDAVVTMDLEGNIVDWNRRAEEIFGWCYDEVVGNPLLELIIPEKYRMQHLDGMRLFKSTGQGRVINQKLELSALRRNGHEFPIELVVTKVDWKQQTIFNAFIRDVSERKEAEQLIAREKLEAALLQQASFAASTSDALEDALRICVANLAEISGWPVGHAFILNQNGTRLVSSPIWHFANRDHFRTLHDASEQLTLSRGEDLPGQVWQRGEPVWITDIEHDQTLKTQREFSQLGVRSAFGFPVKMDGEVIAVVEFFNTRLTTPDLNLLALARGVGNLIRHVIERVQWQEERTRLAAIVESSGDAIIGKAPDGTITSWNSGAEETYGWLAEEVIGETVAVLLPPGMAREESEILEAMKTGRRLDQFQTRRIRKDGTLIDVSISVSPIRGLDQQIVGTSTIERDISARRRREEELSKARDEAEQATRTQSEFLANVSHELRTPMNAILGMLELTLQEDLSPLKRDYLQTAKDSADSLLLLVNDILDFSRLEAGRFELELVAFDLRDLLDEAVKTLSLRACEKGLELICRIDRRVPGRVIGDPVRLRQILTNLAGNAIKFTEQGEVVVDVRLVDETDQSPGENQPGSQVMLEFSVADTGIGIAPEDQQRIFAPFAQADASTTRHYSGTGLGLAICHELIGLMQGEMHLDSAPGQGSRFSFQVAFQVAKPEETDSFRDRSRVSELKDLPVLVVDDNQTNRVILEEMLTNWSMSPKPVDSAQDAIQELNSARQQESGYPLVIVDALMPETDGFMLLEQAREEGLLDTATILMLSSADHQIFGERCQGLDISAFLEKPISQSDLLDAIMTALKGPQLEQDGVVQITETKQSLRVLVAEDTPANQKVITAILKKRGHQCVIANNGREAVDWVRNEDFDVVLMDVQMPTMDGLQATGMIREYEDEAGFHIPIIAMTAYAMRGDREKCISAGMDNYISKPIDAPKLIRLLERLATKYQRPTNLSRVPAEQETVPPAENDSKQSGLSTADSGNGDAVQPLFNMENALKRVGNDPEILNSMVDYFFEDAPGLLREIAQQVQVEDADELARAAHSLKGLCANFDATAATEAARAIEEMGHSGDLQSVPEAIPLLESEVARLIRALLKWRADA